ncbi:MAG: hypothetical protein AAB262_01620 [Elusimicrobiota bacterium]
MKTLLSVTVVLAGLAAPAVAGVSFGVDQTLGSSNYRGTRAKASLDLGDAVYIEPSFSTYRSDTSSGSFNTFGLRGGYETGPVAMGVEAGFQPKTNGYQKTYVGGDLTFSLTPGGTTHGRKMAGPSSEGSQTFGSGLAGVDVGGALMHTRHSDDFSAAGVAAMGRRRAAATARANKLTIGQTDLSVFAGLRFLITEISAEFTKSVYGKNLDAASVREAQALSLSGFGATVQGFPDTSMNLKLKWKSLPLVKPYLSFTRTKFKLGAEPSDAYEAGGTVGLQMLSVKAAYQRYTQKGYTDQNFFSVGAGLNF